MCMCVHVRLGLCDQNMLKGMLLCLYRSTNAYIISSDGYFRKESVHFQIVNNYITSINTFNFLVDFCQGSKLAEMFEHQAT